MQNLEAIGALNRKSSASFPAIPLAGQWLRVGRAAWVVTLLLAVALLIPALNADFQAKQVPCTSGDCSWTLSPEQAEQFQQTVGSLDLYAAYVLGYGVFDMVVFTAIAALIFWRKSHDAMALLVSLMLIGVGAVTATTLSVGWANTHFQWLPRLFAVGAAGLVAAFAYLFPNGRFVPSWTRWLLPLWIAYNGFVWFFPAANATIGGAYRLMETALLVTMVVAQVYRYRRVSTPVQRQQTKWVLLGFVGFLVVAEFVLLVLTPLSRQPGVHFVVRIAAHNLIDLGTA